MPGRTCSEAAEQAERAWNLPPGLLGAIGRTESGRPDRWTGRIEPWPWAINAGGAGRFPDFAAAAIAAVQDSGARHPLDRRRLFPDQPDVRPGRLRQPGIRIDPVANATAAAEFLTELHRRSGGWATAIALYHSALPDRGGPYELQVLAHWAGGRPPMGDIRAGAPVVRLTADPVVVLLAAAAATVRVYTPGSAGAPALLPPGSGPTSAARIHSGRLRCGRAHCGRHRPDPFPLTVCKGLVCFIAARGRAVGGTASRGNLETPRGTTNNATPLRSHRKD